MWLGWLLGVIRRGVSSFCKIVDDMLPRTVSEPSSISTLAPSFSASTQGNSDPRGVSSLVSSERRRSLVSGTLKDLMKIG